MSARLSVGYAAVCEFLFGGIFCLYAVAGVLISLMHPGGRAPLGVVLCLGIAAYSFWTGYSLLQGKRWAWVSSFVLGALVFSFAVMALWTSYRGLPKAHGEEGWAFVMGLVLGLCSMAGLILLSLPQTRQIFVSDR